jgi:hypothetical protein
MNPAPPVTIARTRGPYRHTARKLWTAKACLVPQRDPAAYLRPNAPSGIALWVKVGLEA